MSLRENLNNLIKQRFPDSVHINEIEAYCKLNHFKMSNAERRLRKSESPNISRIENKGAIVGYVWNGGGEYKVIKPTTETVHQVVKQLKMFRY